MNKTHPINSDLLLRSIIFETHKHGMEDSLKYFISAFFKRVANFLVRNLSKYLRSFFIDKNLLKVRPKLTTSQNSYSLSGQDLFVNYLIDSIHSKNYYVEIGAGWPVKINNTYLLEHKYKWLGISIDFDQKMVDNFNEIRVNECLYSDATKINYTDLFISKKMPSEIDYLSLDIDPAYQTLLVLALIPFKNYKFKVLTFEHDSYRHGSLIKIVSRLFLKSNGYFCAYKDVKAPGFGKYEDWWIHPEYISQINAKKVALKIKNRMN
jgi:hypothetical protein